MLAAFQMWRGGGGHMAFDAIGPHASAAAANRHRFGEGLEMVEQQWLVQEINDQIAELQVG